MRLWAFCGGAVLSSLFLVAWPGQAHTEVTVLAQFDATQGQLPESVTRDQKGNLIISMTPQHTLWTIAPDDPDTFAPLATLPVPEGAVSLGVKVGEGGDIFACTAAFDPSLDAAHVWRVTPDGSVSHYASLDASGFPNDLAFDRHGNLLVTDPLLGVIRKVAPDGDASIWLGDPRLSGDPSGPILGVPWGANGIAFDRRDRHLYISNTDFGEIYRIRVRRDGSAGHLVVLASDPRLVGSDGIAVDVLGRVYVAVNSQNSIARIDRHGGLSIVAHAGPFDGPSSLAFASDGFHRTQLYVTSFAFATAESGGNPQPSLDAIGVPFGGLPLP